MKKLIILMVGLMVSHNGHSATELKVGDSAPIFKSQTHDGKDFDLSSRKGKYTILYFYPKADTPGCTKQACAFRDKMDSISKLGAEVYGVSVDTVQDQFNFHKKYEMNFTLIADAEGKVSELYGTKVGTSLYAKRWTFILDPELKIRGIDRDVDPVKDAEKVAALLAQLQKSKPAPADRGGGKAY